MENNANQNTANPALQDDLFDSRLFDDNAVVEGVYDKPAGGEEGFNADPDFYRPSIKHKVAAQNKMYKARLRVLPFYKNAAFDFVKKDQFFLSDGGDESKTFYVDSPSTVMGLQGGKNNIVTQAYFATYKHEYANMRAIGKRWFSLKYAAYMPVQIMIDAQEPDFVNKIKIARFGKHIGELYEKIKNGDPSVGQAGMKPQSLFAGRDLILVVNEKTIEQNGESKVITSYDDSLFDNNITSLSFDGGATRIPKTDEYIQSVKNWLIKETPAEYVEKVQYKPWDVDTENRVIESVKAIINDNTIFDKMYNIVYKSKHSGVGAGQMNNGAGQNNNANAPTTNQPAAMPGAQVNNAATPPATNQNSMSDLKDKVAGPPATSEAPAATLPGNNAPASNAVNTNQNTEATTANATNQGGQPLVKQDEFEEFNFDEQA